MNTTDLHEVHECKTCGAQIMLPYAKPPSGDARCPECQFVYGRHAIGCPSGDAPDLREALRAFGERLAADGYGWEAIITRETPSGEQTVAHLTTANPDPDALATPAPLWGPDGPTVGQVITIAGTTQQVRWDGIGWAAIDD